MKNKHEKPQKNLIYYRQPGGQLSPDYPRVLAFVANNFEATLGLCNCTENSNKREANNNAYLFHKLYFKEKTLTHY